MNKTTLGEEAFAVYEMKRLIRADKYDKIRDKSFDFLQIGEDDIDDFDDFVWKYLVNLFL